MAAGRHAGFVLPSDAASAVRAWSEGQPAEATARVSLQDLGPDAASAAHRLFAALRALDAAGAEVIFARELGGDGLARAVDDRLRRAAT